MDGSMLFHIVMQRYATGAAGGFMRRHFRKDESREFR